jgi:hypothetical protein
MQLPTILVYGLLALIGILWMIAQFKLFSIDSNLEEILRILERMAPKEAGDEADKTANTENE